MIEVVRFGFDKLVRDNIPSHMEEGGAIPAVIYLEEETARLEAAQRKLEEEFKEIDKDADEDELVEELADTYEVVNTIDRLPTVPLRTNDRIIEVRSILHGILRARQIIESRVIREMNRKREDKGGYSKWAHIDSVDVRSDDPWYPHLISQSKKYPVLGRRVIEE